MDGSVSGRSLLRDMEIKSLRSNTVSRSGVSAGKVRVGY